MGRDGNMWLNHDDTMTLEEYRKAREIDVQVEKKSDYVEVVTENLPSDWSE